MNRLIDRYNRKLNYLRISITDRCNLRCQYCVPLTPSTMLTHDDILRYEEIVRIVKIGVDLGISKVRVTGGEPLVRLGVYDFLSTLTAIEGLKDVSLTTNGVLLKDNIDKLKATGIKRINISLDSLQRENFREITGRDAFQKVWDGLEAAISAGFDPIKINVVVLPDKNDQELLDFAELSIRYPFHVRFIEYMPIGQPHFKTTRKLLTPDIKETIGTLGELIPVAKGESDGPAARYKFKNARGEIGFISPISHHFCAQCSRLRLTANGMLRSCLLSDRQVDVRSDLRNGCSDERISEILLDAIRHKQEKHHIDSGAAKIETQMSAIGG